MNPSLTLRRASHASSVAIAVLVVANAVPLLGVLLLGWDLVTLVAVYWAENGVVGLYAIGRILTAGRVMPSIDGRGLPSRPRSLLLPPPPPEPGPRDGAATGLQMVFLVPFFCVHYGIFWFVHGVFVWTVLPILFSGMLGPGTLDPGLLEFGVFGAAPTVIFPDGGVVVRAALILLVSHGVSFVANWLLGGEHLTSTPQAETTAPYARVVVLHLTILLGAFCVVLFRASIAALVVMVVLKTAVDLGAHLAERRRAADRAQRRRATPVPGDIDAPAPGAPA